MSSCPFSWRVILKKMVRMHKSDELFCILDPVVYVTGCVDTADAFAPKHPLHIPAYSLGQV